MRRTFFSSAARLIANQFALLVSCACCGAMPGEPCIQPSGTTVLRLAHLERREAAGHVSRVAQVVTTQQPKPLKPCRGDRARFTQQGRRAARVRSRAESLAWRVTCEVCGAEPGRACRRPNGRDRKLNHSARGEAVARIGVVTQLLSGGVSNQTQGVA